MACEVARRFVLADHVAASFCAGRNAFGTIFTAHLAVTRWTHEGADVVVAADVDSTPAAGSARAPRCSSSAGSPPDCFCPTGSAATSAAAARRGATCRSSTSSAAAGAIIIIRVVAATGRSHQRSRHSDSEKSIEGVNGHSKGFLSKATSGISTSRADDADPSAVRLQRRRMRS